MVIAWDEAKRRLNVATHGFDFATLDEAVFDAAVVVFAKRRRFMAVGFRDAVAVAVVFAPLGTEGISVISMRRASRKERARL